MDITSRFSKGPKFAFGVSGRETLDKNRVPGPGHYTHRDVANARAWSLTPRRPDHRQKKKEDMPGPGAHEVRGQLGQGPKYTVSPRRQDPQLRRGLQPGPGEYDQEDRATSHKPPTWGFGTSSRPDSAGNINAATPGPGAYAQGTKVGQGPKYSMQSRRLGVRAQPSPGPGAHGGHYSTFS